jgi:Tn3 transposase DDE domain-containing protein
MLVVGVPYQPLFLVLRQQLFLLLHLDEKGKLHLPPLEKEVPEEVERLSVRVYGLLPHLPLADLLLEVDNWTGFLHHFTHLTSGDAPIGAQKLELVAALMGMGMNLGLAKMVESCPYTYRQLSWSVDWHIREETLLGAQACLDNFMMGAPWLASGKFVHWIHLLKKCR